MPERLTIYNSSLSYLAVMAWVDGTEPSGLMESTVEFYVVMEATLMRILRIETAVWLPHTQSLEARQSLETSHRLQDLRSGNQA